MGCGFKHMIGAINVDAYASAKPDVLHDLNIIPYPFEGDYFDNIFAHHVFEHLTNWWVAFAECGRILKLGGILEISTPDASSDSALGYRDHVQIFTPYTFHGAFNYAGNKIRHGTNAWAAEVAGTVPLKLISYTQTPHGKFEWMLRWPFKSVLSFCANHLRNFIWQQTFTFQKFDRGVE